VYGRPILESDINRSGCSNPACRIRRSFPFSQRNDWFGGASQSLARAGSSQLAMLGLKRKTKGLLVESFIFNDLAILI
jgi:hypothetical protein